MSDIILTANQYKNLENLLGERNKVTLVKGKEYRIDTSQVFTIESGGKTINVSSPSSAYYWVGTDLSNIFGKHWCIREECCSISGNYDFSYTPTDESFDINSLVPSYELYYKKYYKGGEFIKTNNYSSYACVFKGIKSNSNLQNGGDSDTDWDKDTQCWKTNGMLPHENATFGNWLGQRENTSGMFYPSQYVNVRFLRRQYNSTTQQTTYYFRVSYRFVSATGWNKFFNKFIVSDSYDNYYRELQQIKITIKACSVTSEEVDKTIGNGSQKLELKTNELMQTPITSENSLFDTTANQIVDAYSNNRTLITLKLLEIKKYDFGSESRILRAGDKVKIKNNKGKFISEYTKLSNGQTIIDGNYFEIIKETNNYEGRFYKQLTLREVLREDQ